jgi:hypothetical protein
VCLYFSRMICRYQGSLAYPCSAPAKHGIWHTQDVLPIVSVILSRRGIWYTQGHLPIVAVTQSRFAISGITCIYINRRGDDGKICLDLLGRVLKTSVTYHEASHLLPASVRILFVPMWLWEGLSVYLWKVGGLSPNALYNVSGFSLPPIKHLLPS